MYVEMSALQKAVRRGQEEDAMFWAMEIVLKYKRPHVALNRLRIIAHEDVGLAAPDAAHYALHALDDAARFLKTGNAAWALAFGNAIMLLSRAPKSRMADHFWAAVQARKCAGQKPAIPDYVYDKHTSQGKAAGKGVEDFLGEPTKIAPESPMPDPYRERASQHWLNQEKNGKEINVEEWNGNASRGLFDDASE